MDNTQDTTGPNLRAKNLKYNTRVFAQKYQKKKRHIYLICELGDNLANLHAPQKLRKTKKHIPPNTHTQRVEACNYRLQS